MEEKIEIYNKEEKCNISAKIIYNEECKKDQIFIICHGYCSNKDSNTRKVIADKLLEKGIPSIAFDFPGHGKSVQSAEYLRVKTCISYINSVVNYIKEKYGNNTKISFFATSFGAYILLNKLIGDENKYENIILKSPAINMQKVFKDILLKDSFEQFESNNIGRTGKDGKIVVKYSFYKDLVKNNLYENYKEKRNIIIYQGDLDETALIQDTYKFIENRPEIEIIELKGMKHHMETDELEIVAKQMIEQISL